MCHVKLIPAMSIQDGRVLTVEGGKYLSLKNDQGIYRNPANVARDIPSQELFILDIGGLERNMPDLDTVKRIAGTKDVWLDAGIGDADGMMDAFVSDAARVVMGTICLKSIDELKRAISFSDNLVFSIGYDSGVVSPDKSISGLGAEALRGKMEGIEVKAGLLFDVGGIRDRRPVEPELVSALAPMFDELFVSGHLSKADLPGLEAAGAAGAIVDFRRLGEMSDG